MSCPERVDKFTKKEMFKVAKRMATKAVSKAKNKAYKDMYKRLNSKEMVNENFKLAKTRKRRR